MERPTDFFHENSPKYLYKRNTKWMPFRNPEKPIKPIGKLDILGCRNRHLKHMQIHSEMERPTDFFHENSLKYLYKRNTKWMPFWNSEKPSKPIGKPDILSSRNRDPKHM